MSEIERSVNYAKKRSQALRNCESHLQTILFDVAKQIVDASSKYRVDGRLNNESSVLSDARNIAASASDSIESCTGAYAKASCKILGIGTENIDSFLVGDIFGKTLNERNATYLANFAEDIVRMIKAGTLLGYSDQQILSSIRTNYKDPYKSSVSIDFVAKNGISFHYKYIIIDEYQDTSYVKFSLIKQILEKTGAHLLAVGDDYQSIYRFTGCNLNIFLDFKKYFKNACIMKIENTYRNSLELIQITTKFILDRKSVV